MTRATFFNLIDLLILNLSLPSIAIKFIYHFGESISIERSRNGIRYILSPSISHIHTHIYQQTLKRSA